MIDWEKSADLNEMSVDDLKAWFERYPRSGKRIVAACDGCGKGRNVSFSDYRGLCHSCAQKGYFEDHPECLDEHLRRMKEYWADHEHRKENSERRIAYFKKHPEARVEVSKKTIEQWSDPEVRDGMSRKMIEYYEDPEHCGENDIVGHHMIYDHSDLSKHTMKMTRSLHGRLHALFRKFGIEIPHINVKEEI